MILKRGATYEHVKTGKKYRLLEIARDSKDLEELVVYEALYENEVSQFWIRTKEEFVGEAMSPDGTVHPRFKYIEG